MPGKEPRHLRRQAGITMTEVLLGVAVATAILVGVARFTAQTQGEIRAKNVAEHLQSFQQSAAQYFIANRDAMMSAMADGTGAADYCMIQANPSDGTGGTQANSTTKHTCALDADWLKFKGVMPGSFKATNTYGQRWVAIFRRIYEPGPDSTMGTEDDVATGNADMLVVGMNVAGALSAPFNELATAAEIIGGNGGVIPDQDRVTCKAIRSSSTYEACGTQGGWKVNMSDFIDNAQLATFAAGLPN